MINQIFKFFIGRYAHYYLLIEPQWDYSIIFQVWKIHCYGDNLDTCVFREKLK